MPTEVCADDYTPEQFAIYQHGVEDGKLVARGMERYKAGVAAREAATKPTADLPDENECWVHIYPSDLKRMERTETHATVFSVAVGRAGEVSVPLYTAEQVQSLLATKPAAVPAVPEGWTVTHKTSRVGNRRYVIESARSIRSISEDDEPTLFSVFTALHATPAASTTGAAQTAEQEKSGGAK